MQQQEQQYFEAVKESALRYFRRLGVPSIQPLGCAEGGVFLEDVTAFIQLHGAVEGGFILTVGEGLARALTKLFILDEINDEEAAGYAVEVIAEMANVITGNALTDREKRDIFIGTPLMIVARKAEIRTKCARMQIQAYETPFGKLQCIYIPTDNKSELASILAIQS